VEPELDKMAQGAAEGQAKWGIVKDESLNCESVIELLDGGLNRKSKE